jgi:hypothetical protein
MDITGISPSDVVIMMDCVDSFEELEDIREAANDNLSNYTITEWIPMISKLRSVKSRFVLLTVPNVSEVKTMLKQHYV